jgi:hypothetical protein
MSAELREKHLDGACCAHKRVYHSPVKHDNGTFSDRWECGDCKHQFWPVQIDIESARDTALAVRTAIAKSKVRMWSEQVAAYLMGQNMLDVPILTATPVIEGVLDDAIDSLSTSAEQAALEAIKRQVRQAALREAAKVVCYGCQRGLPLRAGSHEREEPWQGSWFECKATHILALLDNPSSTLSSTQLRYEDMMKDNPSTPEGQE